MWLLNRITLSRKSRGDVNDAISQQCKSYQRRSTSEAALCGGRETTNGRQSERMAE